MTSGGPPPGRPSVARGRGPGTVLSCDAARCSFRSLCAGLLLNRNLQRSYAAAVTRTCPANGAIEGPSHDENMLDVSWSRSAGRCRTLSGLAARHLPNRTASEQTEPVLPSMLIVAQPRDTCLTSAGCRAQLNGHLRVRLRGLFIAVLVCTILYRAAGCQTCEVHRVSTRECLPDAPLAQRSLGSLSRRQGACHGSPPALATSQRCHRRR